MPENQDMPALLAGLEPLSRRSLLRTTALAGMALTTGCARLFGRKEAPEALAYTNLTEDEVRVVTKLTAAILPTEQFGLPSSLNEVPTVQNVDKQAGQMSGQTRELLSLGLWVIEHRPMASFRWKPTRAHPPAPPPRSKGRQPCVAENADYSLWLRRQRHCGHWRG